MIVILLTLSVTVRNTQQCVTPSGLRVFHSAFSIFNDLMKSFVKSKVVISGGAESRLNVSQIRHHDLASRSFAFCSS